MTEEQIKELKQIRKELEIPKEDFLDLSGRSLFYKEFERPELTDEDVFELIKESMMCYDHEPFEDEELDRKKTTKEAFRVACDKIGFERVNMAKTEDENILGTFYL